MIVITGATGHIGSALAEELLGRGKKVRAVGRRSERMARLREQGAESFRADLGDPDQTYRAFVDAQAVFTLVPPNEATDDLRGYQQRIGDSLVEAIHRAGVKKVLNLSSVGAHLAEGLGPVNGLHDVEQKLNALSGVDVLHLRPTYFMENHLGLLPLIRQKSIYASAARPDVKIPMIATRDIAAYAAGRLASLDFQGKSTRELLGPADLGMAEVTTIIGRAIGKPLDYVQLAYPDAERAMVGAGFSEDVARLYMEMVRSMNEGRFKPTEKRSAENTTPTTMEQFAEEVMAPAFRSH